VITLGPLTNLALALEKNPSLLDSDGTKVLIMGGCANGRGNVTRCAEFNIFADPEAAAAVFRRGNATKGLMKVVPWETTQACPMPKETVQRLFYKDANRGPGKFARDVCTLPYKGEKDFVICDVLAMAVALCECMVRECYVHIDVELAGTLTRGMTVVDFGHSGSSHEQGEGRRERNIVWCEHVSPQIYESALFNKTFCRRVSSAQVDK